MDSHLKLCKPSAASLAVHSCFRMQLLSATPLLRLTECKGVSDKGQPDLIPLKNIYFMCRGIYSSCLYVYHTHAQYSWGTEEGIRSPGTRVTMLVLRTEPEQQVLLTSEPFLQLWISEFKKWRGRTPGNSEQSVLPSWKIQKSDREATSYFRRGPPLPVRMSIIKETMTTHAIQGVLLVEEHHSLWWEF